MGKNGTVINVENSIPVMDFTSLNTLLHQQYPGYRVNPNLYDATNSLLSMSSVGILNNLSKNVLSQLQENNKSKYEYLPPENLLFKSKEIKLQN